MDHFRDIVMNFWFGLLRVKRFVKFNLILYYVTSSSYQILLFYVSWCLLGLYFALQLFRSHSWCVSLGFTLYPGLVFFSFDLWLLNTGKLLLSLVTLFVHEFIFKLKEDVIWLPMRQFSTRHKIISSESFSEFVCNWIEDIKCNMVGTIKTLF